MQFNLSLTMLLASIIAASWSPNATFVQAAPARRNAGMVTLPLKRVQPRGNVHPQVMYQQHINRGHRRLARMTGREEPTIREMEEKLVKRILSAGDAELLKRYNRRGTSRLQKRFSRQGLDGLKSKGGKTSKGNGFVASTGNSTGNIGDAGNNVAVGGQATEIAIQNGGLTLANDPLAPNSLGLNVETNDVGYVASVQIGTPPRNFMILMDSGSADFWVGGENCQLAVQGGGNQGGDPGAGPAPANTARDVQLIGRQDNGTAPPDDAQGVAGQAAGNAQAGGCGQHQFIGTQSSSTFQDTQQRFQVKYGTGAVQGTVVKDNVEVAGLKLDGHTFGAASQETKEFADDNTSFDGLIGLAKSTLSNQKTLTVVEAAAKSGLIQEAITSYKISRSDDKTNDGEITFGGLDNTKFDTQTLQTVDNINQDGFWEAPMNLITVDGQDTGLQNRTAILDTGTTLIVAPADDADTIHQKIPGAKPDGQGGFTLPCDTKASVALEFGGLAFNIDPRDLVFAPANGGDCLSGITAGQLDGPQQWLVGDVFLKNAYFSTNVPKNQLSLAKLV